MSPISPTVSSTPPRAPPVKYAAPLGTRWDKEKAAAGGSHAFDLPTDPKFIGPWIIGECVGKGASGRVKIAKHRITGQLAAVKILPLAPLVNSRRNVTTEQQAKSEKQRLGIDREITMMKLMNHPNILRIYDVYEGAKELFLVLEYVEGGELFDFLVNRGRLPSADARVFFRQIILGLNYAHTFSIIHRDLKPENILIASLNPPLLKIADWGMAAFAPPTLQLETSCGSPHYASPEIVNGERYQGNATDIWSCGVILFALLTGRLPFDDKNVKALLAKVKLGKYEVPAWVDPLARDLLQKMLVVDAKKRIKIPDILAHPWLTTILQSPKTASASVMEHLPPSPSTLAQPIPSASLIDPALFDSLRVIWGRHADKDGANIRQDLLSAKGEGTHAKAFYYLLGQFREEHMRERGLEGAVDNSSGDKFVSGKVLGESLTFNLGWELPLEPMEAIKTQNSPPLADGSQVQRTISPSSPSIVSRVSRGVTHPTSAPVHRSSFDKPGLPPLPRRGYTYSAGTSRAPVGSEISEQNRTRSPLQRARSHRPRNRTDDPSSSVYPAEGGARPSIPLTELRPRIPRERAVSMAVKPPRHQGREQTENVGPQSSSIVGGTERRPRDRATSLAAAAPIVNANEQTVPARYERRQLTRHRQPPVADSAEKENQGAISEEGKDGKGDGRKSLGIVKKGKLRPPPLEFPFPPLSRKRSTGDVPPPLGLRNQSNHDAPGQPPSTYASTSKNPMASPNVPPPSFSAAAGPMSPRTPGWLSSLFSGWRSSSGDEEMKLLCAEDVQRTKIDIVGILEGLGVSVQVLEGHNEDMVLLKCGYKEKGNEDSTPIDEGINNLKPVRFRVEIYAGAQSASPQMLSPPMSPLVSPALPLPSPRMSCDSNAPSPACSVISTPYFPPSVGPRQRSTTSPLPTPTSYFNHFGLPDAGNGTTVTMRHEKGSNVTLKMLWRRMKDMHASSRTALKVPGWAPSSPWVVVDDDQNVGIAV